MFVPERNWEQVFCLSDMAARLGKENREFRKIACVAFGRGLGLPRPVGLTTSMTGRRRRSFPQDFFIAFARAGSEELAFVHFRASGLSADGEPSNVQRRCSTVVDLLSPLHAPTRYAITTSNPLSISWPGTRSCSSRSWSVMPSPISHSRRGRWPPRSVGTARRRCRDPFPGTTG